MEQVSETVPPATRMIYDVFINHRGPDVKKTLASLIYHRLRNCGLSVFLDKNEMNRGEVIQHAIRNAIQTARIHVAIFSQSYAESTWCLEELNLMWESRKEGRSSIITIFCDVNPRDLRRIGKGRYAQFFEKHKSENRVSEEDLKKWKDALYNVSFISGIKFRAQKSDHGVFLEEVAKRVFNLEQPKSEPVEFAKDEVGLKQAAEDIQSRILQIKNLAPNNSKVTVIVQIVGMVGVGKSTLAKYLYNRKRSEFKAWCFVNDVSKQEELTLLQNLHHGLFSYKLKCIRDASQAKRILRTRRRNLSSIFLVLDDVRGADEKEKIESLLDMDVMAPGSLVLITSREKLLLEGIFAKLDKAKLDNVMTLVYEVKLMEEEHARELFCSHAFHQPTPPERFEDLTVQSLQICGGLPSSLEILGGHFCNERDEEEWKQQLEGFSKTPPKDIIDRLKGSYEALDPEEKEVFLDIGCFLVGEEQKLAIAVLKGLYAHINIEENLRRLRRKCLVRDPMIGYNHSGPSLDMISMPDPLSRLARDIARKKSSRRNHPKRFSCSNDIEKMSEMPSEKFQTWGIRFSKTPAFMEGITVNTEGVRLFVAEGGVDLSSFFRSWHISGMLVWLRLAIRNSFRFPESISLQTLRVLELEGQEDDLQHFLINCLYDEDRRDLNTPAQTSSIFSTLRRNRALIPLFRQQQFAVTQYVERRVPGMGALTALELKNITSLRSLPIDFSRLPNLTQLDLSGCLNLTELPSLSNLLKLEFLNINECSNLETLNVEGLTSLKEIKALGCWKLKKICDLNRRERLNCLYISTDNPLIWKYICKFLRSPSHQKPSAAIFSGRRVNDERVINPEMIHQIARVENLGKPEITIGDIHSYGAIMFLFITDARSPEFSVTIKQSHNGSSGSALEYRTARANRGGRFVNVLIFPVFKEGKSGIDVCCSHLDSILEGRVVMVDKDADVPKVCEKIMRVYL